MSFLVSAAVVATKVAVGVAIVKTVQGGVNMYKANKAESAAEAKAMGLEEEIDYLSNNRQEIINPWAGSTNLSDMAVDLSSMAQDLSGMIEDTSDYISNPMANLSVSTAAAQFQAEEADIALANTLDTLQATGSSAGGATALAQAALQSKRGVAASIEQQEKMNADKAAQGEIRLQDSRQREAQRLQKAKFSEAGRIQNIKMSEAERIQTFGINEAARMQNLDAKSEMFQFDVTNERELLDLDRKQNLLTGQEKAQQQAKKDWSNSFNNTVDAVGDGISAVGNLGG